MTTRVIVVGASGLMGSACVAAIEADPALELAARIDQGDDLAGALSARRPDVVVEFTTPAAIEANARTVLEAGIPLVSGTTGLPRDRAEALGELAARRGVGFLLAPNFAIGVLLMQRFARQAAQHFADVEILELHHDRKLDAPSGTAIDTARQIAEAAGRPLNAERPAGREEIGGCRGGRVDGIPVHSVRLPGLLAHQEVVFGGLGQVLTLRHDCLDRQAFMPGVLLAIRRIATRTGLVASLEELLD